MRLTEPQRRGLAVLYLVQGSEWRGDRSDAEIGKITSVDPPTWVRVESKVARALEEFGLAQRFTRTIVEGVSWQERVRITDAGCTLAKQLKRKVKP